MKTIMIAAIVLSMSRFSSTDDTQRTYLLENTFTHEQFEYDTNDTLVPYDTVLIRIEMDCSMLSPRASK